jgi:hypothetical protein
MRKLLLGITLIAISTSAMAEWTRVGGPYALNGMSLYIDLKTLHKGEDNVKIWVIRDFKSPQEDPAGKYLSAKLLEEFDCKNEQHGLIYGVQYLNNMGYGQVIWSGKLPHDMSPIVPGSTGEDLFKIVCGRTK